MNRVYVSILSLIVLSLAACGSSGSISNGNGTPTVSGLSSSSVRASSSPQTITVDGSNFQAGLTITLVTPSGTTHPSPSQVTATSLQITAIFGVGNFSISVTNPSGQSSSSYNFTVKAAAGFNLAPPFNYATGATTSGPGAGSASIAIADFNGDGKLDIAVSNYASNTISVFLNKGDGSFGSPILTTVNPLGALGLGAIVAGDFNEDGKVDLIVGTIAGGQSDIVLLGKGDGSFTEGTAIPSSFGFFQAKAGDLNSDKHLDIVAGDNGNMSVALGKGDGTFNANAILMSGPFPDAYTGIDVGALTGNGKMDIVGADVFSNPGQIVVYPGNGDGTFGTPSAQVTPLSEPDSVALADFNGDGKPDLLIGYGSGTAAIATGNGDYTFNLTTETPIYAPTGQPNGIYVSVADLDNDGKPDALILDYENGILTVVLNDSTTISAGSKHTYTLAAGTSDLAVGDLNGDGMPDVVVVNNMTNQISVFLSQN